MASPESTPRQFTYEELREIDRGLALRIRSLETILDQIPTIDLKSYWLDRLHDALSARQKIQHERHLSSP